MTSSNTYTSMNNCVKHFIPAPQVRNLKPDLQVDPLLVAKKEQHLAWMRGAGKPDFPSSAKDVQVICTNKENIPPNVKLVGKPIDPHALLCARHDITPLRRDVQAWRWRRPPHTDVREVQQKIAQEQIKMNSYLDDAEKAYRKSNTFQKMRASKMSDGSFN